MFARKLFWVNDLQIIVSLSVLELQGNPEQFSVLKNVPLFEFKTFSFPCNSNFFPSIKKGGLGQLLSPIFSKRYHGTPDREMAVQILFRFF